MCVSDWVFGQACMTIYGCVVLHIYYMCICGFCANLKVLWKFVCFYVLISFSENQNNTKKQLAIVCKDLRNEWFQYMYFWVLRIILKLYKNVINKWNYNGDQVFVNKFDQFIY